MGSYSLENQYNKKVKFFKINQSKSINSLTQLKIKNYKKRNTVRKRYFYWLNKRKKQLKKC